MDQMDDEIMAMFVEDTREHLGSIESALMDMERDGAAIDEELVNKVFRAAHSIKGGAGFLNLANVRDLAHKLENLLHLIRNRELVPDSRVITRLLAGFDRLLSLVELAQASDEEDIAVILADLSGLTEEHLTTEQKAQAVAMLPIGLPGAEPLFREDELSVRQALAGGKNLYLVEYDLIHDVQARGKTPLDVINTMESSGLIIDCRMELASVGDLDAPPVNRIPFYVLYASIVEPDIVGYLFALDPAHIHPVDLEAAAATGAGPAAAAAPEATGQDFGPWRLDMAPDKASLSLPPGVQPEAATAREALLAALARRVSLDVYWNDPATFDLALVQVLASAARAFADQGLTLSHGDGRPAALERTVFRAGITSEALARAGIPAPLFVAA